MGARRSFRNSIRLFCREGRARCRGPKARGNALDSVVRFVLRRFGSHSRDRIQTRRTRSRRNDYIVTTPLSAWNEGIAGSHVRTLGSGGISFMWTVTETRFRRAPWGRKKHLMPLPILSVVLLVTAMAAPGRLHMTVPIIAAPNLNFPAPA